MRMFAGADAAISFEFAAEEDRIVREVRTRNRFAVKSKQQHARRDRRASQVLEKEQANQRNDRDPRDRIRHNDPVPQSATGRIVLLQDAAGCMVSDHRRLPGRRFQDDRLVSCSHFPPASASRSSANS
jgi:hypothetical protein